MKSQKFRLKAILSYNRFKKMQAAGHLAEAAQRRLVAYEAMMECMQILTDLEDQLQMVNEGGSRASELLMMQNGIAEQRRQIMQACSRYDETLQEEQTRRAEVLQAQQDYEAILKLEEKHLQALGVEALRREELALNEFTAARFKHRVSA